MFYKLQSIVEIDRIYTVAQGKNVFSESIDVEWYFVIKKTITYYPILI